MKEITLSLLQNTNTIISNIAPLKLREPPPGTNLSCSNQFPFGIVASRDTWLKSLSPPMGSTSRIAAPPFPSPQQEAVVQVPLWDLNPQWPPEPCSEGCISQWVMLTLAWILMGLFFHTRETTFTQLRTFLVSDDPSRMSWVVLAAVFLAWRKGVNNGVGMSKSSSSRSYILSVI